MEMILYEKNSNVNKWKEKEEKYVLMIIKVIINIVNMKDNDFNIKK